MKKTYTFHEDPGHGWLEVPVTDLVTLGIKNKISPYSFISANGQRAFLEEDCDATYFKFKAKQAGWEVTETTKYHTRFESRQRPQYPFNVECNYEAQSAEKFA